MAQCGGWIKGGSRKGQWVKMLRKAGRETRKSLAPLQPRKRTFLNKSSKWDQMLQAGQARGGLQSVHWILSQEGINFSTERSFSEQVEIITSWLRTKLVVKKCRYENRPLFQEVWFLPCLLGCLIQGPLSSPLFFFDNLVICVLVRMFICHLCLKYSLSHCKKLKPSSLYKFSLTTLLITAWIYLLVFFC